MLPLLGLILPLAKNVITGITGHFAHKRKIKEERQRGEIEWAKYMAQASGKSWKDEYFTVLWTLPIALAMFGYTAPLEKLLLILLQLPEWYTYLLLTMTLASFGLSATGRWKERQTRQRLVLEKGKDQSDHYDYAGQPKVPKPSSAVMDHGDTSD